MHIKLQISDNFQIESVKVIQQGKEPREAERNQELINIINSIEIDLTDYLKMKKTMYNNEIFKTLVSRLDLSLIL